MDWVKIITPPEEVKEAGIAVVPLSATHSYVLKDDVGRITEIVGRRPREGAYSYGKFEGVKIDDALPVMVFIHLGKEVVDLFGLKKIYFKKNNETVTGSNFDPSDARNFFVFINCTPGGGGGEYGKVPDVLRFGDFEIIVPDEVRATFNRAGAHAKVHEIKDDNGNTIAYSRDNKVWIPFDVAAMEHGGRELNWMPTSVTRLILQRAVGPALTQDPPAPTEEERIAILKKSEDKWCEVWKSDSTQRIESVRKQLKRNETEYQNLCAQMVDCVTNRENYNRQLFFERSSGDKNEVALKEFERILENVPELVSVEFNGSEIRFRTSMIFLEEDMANPPQKFDPFPLGEFEIMCKAGQVPTLTNLTRTLSYDGETWHAPHAKSGHICWGNISGKISEYSAMRRWHDVVTLCIQYLKNVMSTDEWGKRGFREWKEAGKMEVKEVLHKDKVAQRAIEWAKVIPNVRIYNLKPDDEVLAKCPAGCPLLNQFDDQGKAKCPIQGEGQREGKVKEMLDEFVNIKWQHTMKEGEKPTEVDCIGFDYDHVLRLDGEPMYEGHKPPCLYPEQEQEQEIREGMQGVVDVLSKVVAARQAKIAQGDSLDDMTLSDDEEELLELDDVTRMLDDEIDF